MIQKLIVLSVFILGFSWNATAQVEWSYAAKASTEGTYEITFTAEVEAGWFIYSQFIGDDGPIPTTFEFNPVAGAELIGKTSESGYKKSGYDKVFGMDLVKFGKTVTFVQKVKATKGTAISGYFTYMTCNDEQCLPPKDVDFELVLN